MCKGPADNCVVHDKQPDSDDEEVRGWASNRSLASTQQQQCAVAARVCMRAQHGHARITLPPLSSAGPGQTHSRGP